MPFFIYLFFFLALILSCLTFLWSYSVLPFSVRRFEGKEAQYAEREKKKILYCFWWAASQLGQGSSLRERDERKGGVGDCQQYDSFDSFFCSIKKDFGWKKWMYFCPNNISGKCVGVSIQPWLFVLLLGPFIFSNEPQFNILSCLDIDNLQKWN